LNLTKIETVNIRGGNVCLLVGTSVRPYIRPQNVCPISMKFGVYIDVDEWCMTVCSMTRFKVKVTASVQFRKLHLSNSISSAIYNGSWQMTT